MAIPQYDELMLRMEPSGHSGYTVTAFGPDRSTATGEFTSPVSEVELDNFILRVARPRVVRSAHSSELLDAKELGGELFERLLCNDVGDVYHGARKVAESQGRGLRITLSMTGAPELLEIPWELLYDRGAASFLSDSIFTPVVRTLDLKSPPKAPPLTLPFNVLGVVSSPSDFPALDTDAEREKLEKALAALIHNGAVKLEWLEEATLSALDRRIAAPDELHVIHYIGHGAYDKRTRGGILALEDASGAAHEVSGEDLGRFMKDERSLRLVVLNSCEGARASHVDPFSGVATSLLRCGLPAVIGMQAEITDEAAIAFSDRLYTALAQGFPIDAALAQARRAIAAAGKEVEFGTPVLFMRVSDGRIFNVTEVLPPPAPGRIEAELHAEPEAVQAGGAVTWQLEIRNAGGSRLTDITARDRGGETRAGPLQLEPGGGHKASWTEAVESDVEERVTIEGRDIEGRQVSDDPHAHVRLIRGGGWSPPGKAVLAAGAVALVALVALGFILLGGGGGGGGTVAFDSFPIDNVAGDLDARGEQVAFVAATPDPPGPSEIFQLSLDGGQSPPVGPMPAQYQGIDVGQDSHDNPRLVYARCDPPNGCHIYTKSFGGSETEVAVREDGCSDTRPNMWSGRVLFARTGAACALPGLILKRGTRVDRIDEKSAGADLNAGRLVWLAGNALTANSMAPDGTLTPAGSLTAPEGEAFQPPLVTEADWVYFIHRPASQRDYLARAHLPLTGSEKIEHYMPRKDDNGAAGAFHFGVTGGVVYITGYPQPDGKPGGSAVVRVPKPKFEPVG